MSVPSKIVLRPAAHSDQRETVGKAVAIKRVLFEVRLHEPLEQAALLRLGLRCRADVVEDLVEATHELTRRGADRCARVAGKPG